MTLTESAVLVAAIAAVPPTIVGTASLVASLKNKKSLVEADKKLGVVHELVNAFVTNALERLCPRMGDDRSFVL